jgi:hypothetical protein
LLILLVAAALLPLTLTLHADARVPDRASAAASPPAKKKVEQRHKEWIRLSGQILRHRARFAHLKRTDSVRSTGGSMRVARAEEYACVVRTNRDGVIAYPPLRAAAYGNSFSHRWMLFVYRFDRARRLGNVVHSQQQQFEMCAVGGGHTWNDWATDFDGASVTLGYGEDIRIGQSWGERVADDGGVHADLGFKLARGFAEVGASVPVGIDDEHRFTGTDGYDDHINLTWVWDDSNRVNAYYESGDDWTFQGTDRNVGNTLHVLYETPQAETKPLHWIISSKIRAHCTKLWQIFGRECEDFD